MIDPIGTRYFVFGTVTNAAPLIKETYRLDVEHCWFMKAMPSEDYNIDFVSEELANELLGKDVYVEMEGGRVIELKVLEEGNQWKPMKI